MITRDEIVTTLTTEFPDFTPDAQDLDLLYAVLGSFARFLLQRQEANDEQALVRAVQLIESFYTHGDPHVREATTVGLLEGVQNVWGGAGADPEMLGRRLLPESRRWWDSLNKFWRKEIPHVGADLGGSTEPSGGDNAPSAGQ